MFVRFCGGVETALGRVIRGGVNIMATGAETMTNAAAVIPFGEQDWLILSSAALATFVASVIAKEQNDRLTNGVFGALAGSTVGGVVALLSKEPRFLLDGFFGSSLGAFCGWVVYMILTVLATFGWGRRLVEYQASGLDGVRSRLQESESNLLYTALATWARNLSRLVDDQVHSVSGAPLQDANQSMIRLIIHGWLAGATDVFNLILDSIANRKQYRIRTSIIVFGLDNGKVAGRHWISYTGEAALHRPRVFDRGSFAFKVLNGDVPSPWIVTLDEANTVGQKRDEADESPYKMFVTYRINDRAVLTVDWPDSFDTTNDQYFRVARDFFHADLVPAVHRLLSRWPEDLSAEAGFAALGTIPIPPEHAGSGSDQPTQPLGAQGATTSTAQALRTQPVNPLPAAHANEAAGLDQSARTLAGNSDTAGS